MRRERARIQEGVKWTMHGTQLLSRLSTSHQAVLCVTYIYYYLSLSWPALVLPRIRIQVQRVPAATRASGSCTRDIQLRLFAQTSDLWCFRVVEVWNVPAVVRAGISRSACVVAVEATWCTTWCYLVCSVCARFKARVRCFQVYDSKRFAAATRAPEACLVTYFDIPHKCSAPQSFNNRRCLRPGK